MASFEFPEGDQPSSPNREQLLRMAISAADKGNKDAARMMFRQVLDEDARSERSMMWLAKLADTKEERRQWLNRVLQVNPNNDAARDALDRMTRSRAVRESRTLILYGVVAVVLIALLLVVLILVFSR